MKVFVAGAAGALGRPLVPRLVAAGHEVTGTTRRPERAERIDAAGGRGVVCDVYDADALSAAVAGAGPEVVINALSALPRKLTPRRDYLAPTNRLRTEGTDNLIAASVAAGARRLVAESVAFLYAPGGDGPHLEEDPIDLDAPGNFGKATAALAHLERASLETPELEGLVLRLGYFYGPGTHLAPDGTQGEDIRRRRFPIIGDGRARFSFLHVEDAATAFTAAVDHGAPGAYNVVDDEPSPQREWLPELAAALGAKPPRKVPEWLAKLAVGGAAIDAVQAMSGASNEKAKRELGWQPRYASWRQGFREALG